MRKRKYLHIMRMCVIMIMRTRVCFYSKRRGFLPQSWRTAPIQVQKAEDSICKKVTQYVKDRVRKTRL